MSIPSDRRTDLDEFDHRQEAHDFSAFVSDCNDTGTTLTGEAAKGVPINGFRGMLALERGFIFTSMIAAAVSVFLIEREFRKASLWSLAAAVMAFFGVIHTYEFSGNETVSLLGWSAGGQWAFGWFCFAVIFIVFHFWERAVRKKTGRGLEIQEH